MEERINIFEEIANNVIDSDLLKKRKILKAKVFNEGKSVSNTIVLGESENGIGNLELLNKRNLKNEIRRFVGKVQRYPEEIGVHPDFKYLEEGQTENHYIVSVFIDIKGSTKLATFLELEEVRRIKNNILITAIQVFQALDGHIHRLQGDALFAFFGRKDMKKSNAIIDALNAVTFLQFSFHKILSKRFEEAGFPEIKIRSGIDFGDNDKVLWSKYGIQNCHEITTTSLHTDLAAKLQSKAGANKVMIGDNVREYIDLPEEFYSKKQVQKNYEKVYEDYIINYNEFRYRMWEFNWEKYLNRFINMDKNSNLPAKYQYISPNDYIVECSYKLPNENNYIKYPQNALALPKGTRLKFHIKFISPYLINLPKNIVWEVNNRGHEAEDSCDDLTFEMKGYKNKEICYQETAYKGHHYMRVIIKDRMNRIIGEDYFGLYICDE